VKVDCADAVSEVQRLGCESHVTDADLPYRCPARHEVGEQVDLIRARRRQMYRPGRLNFMPTV
jgi:hypothetical protein